MPRRRGSTGAGRRPAGGKKRSGGARKRPASKAARPVSRRTFLKIGLGTAAVAVAGGGAASYGAGQLNQVGEHGADRLHAMRGGQIPLLFERFPGLANTVPWRPLGTFPTPIEALTPPDGAGDVALFVKRDDRSSPLYGGNKLRKLEFFLADAGLSHAGRIITAGGIGTNHGLATALHARAAGLEVHLALYDQPVTGHVRANLRALDAAGARVRHDGGELAALRAARILVTEARHEGAAPYFIMIGGSSRLGTLGHVNAGLELAQQVEAGRIPEPARVFVALGSGGTAAGLAAGFRLAGLRTRVTAVRVGPTILANSLALQYLANDALRWLQSADPAVPRTRVRLRDFDVVTDQLGAGYGHPTDAAHEAVAWALPRLELETAYTGKAMAACLQYCRTQARPGETILFWNTFNSAPVASPASLKNLPPSLQAVALG